MSEQHVPPHIYLCLILAPVLWGGNFVAGQFLGSSLSGATTNLLRWLVALVVLLPILAPALIRHRAGLMTEMPRLLGLAALGVAGFNTVLYEGLRLASVSIAAIAFAVTPLMITGLATLLDRRPPSPRLVLGAVVAFAGMLTAQADALQSGAAPLGIALVFLAAVIWTVYSVALRRGSGALPPGPAFLMQVVFGTLMLVPLALLLHRPGEIAGLTAPAWAAILYLGLFAAALAFFLWQQAVAAAGPAMAGVFMNLVPIASLALGWVILAEPLSARETVAFTVVLLGVAISALPEPLYRARVSPRALISIAVILTAAPSRIGGALPV